MNKFVILSAHRQAVYERALAFVDAAEPDPRFPRLSRHYRNRRGELITSLEELVRAILADDLMTEAEPMELAA